jgi:hypothetical protein
MTRRDRIDVVTSLLGAALVSTALVLIWVARAAFARFDADANTLGVYVSELGAAGAPTARMFEISLLMIVAGGSLIAFAGKDIRSRLRLLALWTPAISIWVSCGFFLVASQVTCRYGCPLPTLSPFDAQDFTHISCAVLAFLAACWAMLQTSFAHDHKVLRRFSLTMAIAVGVISGIGGILSLARFDTKLGGDAEFAATSLAIGWVVVYGIVIAAGRIRGQRRAGASGDISSSNRLASPTRT